MSHQFNMQRYPWVSHAWLNHPALVQSEGAQIAASGDHASGAAPAAGRMHDTISMCPRARARPRPGPAWPGLAT